MFISLQNSLKFVLYVDDEIIKNQLHFFQHWSVSTYNTFNTKKLSNFFVNNFEFFISKYNAIDAELSAH